MLNQEMRDIIRRAEKNGWVLEPEAKRLLSLAGIPVPRYRWAADLAEALEAADAIGYPVVAKVVSAQIVHKSEVGGVVVGIKDQADLKRVCNRLNELNGFAGILVEEPVAGVELIVGAKIDYQFGPVVLLGIGGTGVEIYRDTALKMAPLAEKDIASMVGSLKGGRLLRGYRGTPPVDMEALIRLLKIFSDLVMHLEDRIDSIDLNPVKCSPHGCVTADARIMLAVT